MLRHQYTDRICAVVLVATILLTCLYMGAAAAGLVEGDSSVGYEARLFDQSRVHTIDIVMDDWDGFIDTCQSEEYSACTLIIDGEAYGSVAIRGKGNTSLSSVASYGNDRYSFKVEFDHYDPGRTYHGLDKLCLNNLIQDATCMKDYLAYTLMGKMGVASPLTAFAEISVNGEPWGLYLAVEAVEESFLTRNYGGDYGELYKPDSMSMGGGRGNGRDFDMDKFGGQFAAGADEAAQGRSDALSGGMGRGQNAGQTGFFDPTGSSDGTDARGQAAGGMAQGPGGDGGGMGSSDVMLQYTGDDPENYPNIFGSAKTDVSEADQQRLIGALKTLTEGETAEEKQTAADAEAVIRYLAVHDFLVNGDSYTGGMVHNYYLYEEDGALSMIPWDYNLAMGAFGMGGTGASGATDAVNSPIDSPVSSGGISSRPMISWIFESEEYTARYHEIYAEFIGTVFDSGWMEEELARVTEMIAPYVEADVNGFFTYEEFLTATETLPEFMALRAESVKGQLNGSIPSTTEGQRNDPSALIDASHIDLSDMGSMGRMGGGEKSGFGAMPEGFDPSQREEGFGAMPEGFDPSQMENGMMKPGRQAAETDAGAGEEEAGTENTATETEEGFGTMPEGFDPSQREEGFGAMPEGFDPSQMENGMMKPGRQAAETDAGAGEEEAGTENTATETEEGRTGDEAGGFDPSQRENGFGAMPEGFDPSQTENGMMKPFRQAAETDAGAGEEEAGTENTATETEEGRTGDEAGGFDLSQREEGFGAMPEGFDPSQTENGMMKPFRQAAETDAGAGEEEALPGEAVSGDGGRNLPGEGGRQNAAQGDMQDAGGSAEPWMMTAICAAVLSGGIWFAATRKSGR